MSRSGDILSGVFREHLVDQRLRSIDDLVRHPDDGVTAMSVSATSSTARSSRMRRACFTRATFSGDASTRRSMSLVVRAPPWAMTAKPPMRRYRAGVVRRGRSGRDLRLEARVRTGHRPRHPRIGLLEAAEPVDTSWNHRPGATDGSQGALKNTETAVVHSAAPDGLDHVRIVHGRSNQAPGSLARLASVAVRSRGCPSTATAAS